MIQINIGALLAAPLDERRVSRDVVGNLVRGSSALPPIARIATECLWPFWDYCSVWRAMIMRCTSDAPL